MSANMRKWPANANANYDRGRPGAKFFDSLGTKIRRRNVNRNSHRPRAVIGLSLLAVCLFLVSRLHDGKGARLATTEPMLEANPRFKPSDWKPRNISVGSTNSVIILNNETTFESVALMDAVEEMTKEWANHDFQSPYKKNSTQLINRFEDERKSNSSVPHVVVFYHISFPLGRKREAMLALRTQLDVLSLGSYDIISRSYVHNRPVIVYYTIAGGTKSNVDYVKTLCRSKRKQLDCRLLGEYDTVTPSGTTLQNLYRFCSSRPEVRRVSYLTNLLPRRYGVNVTEAFAIPKTRAYSTAVMSNMCLKERGDSCNVCGAEFYSLPFNHFRGNMFTSTCEYVKQLREPAEFEERMDKVAGDALVWKLRNMIGTNLFGFDPELLGLSQYNVLHWIGSHPNLKPCDVAPVRYSWLNGGLIAPNDYSRYAVPLSCRVRHTAMLPLNNTTDNIFAISISCRASSKAYDFRWALAPRRSSAPLNTPLARQREDEVRADEAKSFQEYWYLAGQIHKWHSIYDAVPREDSWVWKWFPRGKEWLEGWNRFGKDVVRELATPHVDANEGVP